MTLFSPVEERVTNLEELMAQLTRNVGQLSDEMRDFKDEMREYKNTSQHEMREFKDEMREYKNTSQRETREFKDEMREYKEESRRETREMRKQWGELSNRMGTMVEDLVAPSIGRILRTVTNCSEEQIHYSAIRVKRRRPSDNQQREFDAIAVCNEYMLINETKSQLRPEDVATFVQSLSEARSYFPEYADKKIIGAIASLYVDESLVRYGERQGLIVLGFGEDVMDVLNSPNFQPKTF